VLSELDAPLFPDQSPEATQFVASVLFQFSVVESFCDTLAGLVENDNVGAGAATVMLTVWFDVPPGPLQDRLNTLSEVSDDIVWEPDVALLPDQSPDAVQSLARLLLQLIVVKPFIVTVVGLADNEIAGGLRPLAGLFGLSFIIPAASAPPLVRFKIKPRQIIIIIALAFAIIHFLTNKIRSNQPSITRTALQN
jgi:hypothetical protein